MTKHLFKGSPSDEGVPFPKLFETYFLKAVETLKELETSGKPATLHLHSTKGAQKPKTPKDFVMYLCEQLTAKNVKVIVER